MTSSLQGTLAIILTTSRPVLLGCPVKTLHINTVYSLMMQMSRLQLAQYVCSTREECGVHTNTESTYEDLPIEQSDQDPHQGCQKGPLNHGRKKVPAAATTLIYVILVNNVSLNIDKIPRDFKYQLAIKDKSNTKL